MYGQVDAIATSHDGNDYELPKGYDTEAAVSTNIRTGVKLYHPTTCKNERDDELPSYLKVYFYDLTVDKNPL